MESLLQEIDVEVIGNSVSSTLNTKFQYLEQAPPPPEIPPESDGDEVPAEPEPLQPLPEPILESTPVNIVTPRGQSGGQGSSPEGRPSSEASPAKIPKPVPRSELEQAFDMLSHREQREILQEMGGVFNANLFEL